MSHVHIQQKKAQGQVPQRCHPKFEQHAMLKACALLLAQTHTTLMQKSSRAITHLSRVCCKSSKHGQCLLAPAKEEVHQQSGIVHCVLSIVQGPVCKNRPPGATNCNHKLPVVIKPAKPIQMLFFTPHGFSSPFAPALVRA